MERKTRSNSTNSTEENVLPEVSKLTDTINTLLEMVKDLNKEVKYFKEDSHIKSAAIEALAAEIRK